MVVVFLEEEEEEEDGEDGDGGESRRWWCWGLSLDESSPEGDDIPRGVVVAAG